MKSFAERLRTLLVLGRISNLPTVWSNLITGWIIAGGNYNTAAFVPPLIGGSFLYVGGMYLNDWCDADFDARYCPERPIPAEKISRRAVGIIAVVLFTLGLASLAVLGPITAGIALLLLAAIVLYNFHHKSVVWAPLLMGFCRFLLYPLAASSGQNFMIDMFVPIGQPGPSIDSIRLDMALSALPAAIPLGLYVAGITYYARGESRPTKPTRWALVLVLMPVLVQVVLHLVFASQFQVTHFNHPYDHIRDPQMLFSWWFWQSWWVPYSLLFLGWIAWLLIPLWRGTEPSIGRVVAGMLAGIVLVDMMALTGAPFDFPPTSLIVYFLLALLLQRVIPAT